MSIWYRARAWHNVAPVGYVYWEKENTPDLTGASSPYPPSEYDDPISQIGMRGSPSGGSGDVVGPAGCTTDRIATYDGATGKLIKDGGYTIAEIKGSGTGDVTGPSKSVDGNIVLFNLATGKVIKDSGHALSDYGDLSGPAKSGDDEIVVFSGTDSKLVKTSVTKLTALEYVANKGAISGYAGLDKNQLVPSANLGTGGKGAGALVLADNQTWIAASGGAGDVVGPAVAVDSDLVVFNTTTGKLVKDGGITIANLAPTKITESKGPTVLSVGNISDTQWLTRSGSSVVGAAAPMPAITGVASFYAVITGTGNDIYTKLLMHFELDSGYTLWIDSAKYPHPAGSTGSVVLSSTQKKFGSTSAYFSAGTHYVTFADHPDWFMDGDFTVDAWVYATSLPGNGVDYMLFCRGSAGTDRMFLDLYNNAGTYQWIFRYNKTAGQNVNLIVTTTMTANAWHHIAVVHSGTNYYIFEDGLQLGATLSNADALGSVGTTLIIGNYYSLTLGWVGYIDEFRWTKGIGRWTAGFSLPTACYGGPQLHLTDSTGLIYQVNNP